MLYRYVGVIAAVAALFATACAVAAGAPPATPEVREPGFDGQVLNPADVHMEISGFADPDGAGHRCSDWQISSTSPAEVAWEAICAEGPDSTHIHLGDGDFVDGHAGRTELKHGSQYVLQVRLHDEEAETSARAERPFATSPKGPEGTPAPVPWAVRSDFEVGVLAGGFRLPVGIAIAPEPGNQPDDPLLYVAELYGGVKVVTNDGTVSDYATGLLNFNPTGNFPGSGEKGVGGIAVDPDSGDLFATLVYADTSAPNPQPHYAKVVRLPPHDGGLTTAGQETVLDMAGEPQSASHQVSSITIGPDGNLYVHTGDGGVPSSAQDLDQFRGKVLRMTLDGDPLPDNPFFDAGDGIGPRDYVFAYGFRNAFGGAWRAADGAHYAVENGPSVDRLARIDRGANYCWVAEPPEPPCEWAAINDIMRHRALYNWEPSHAPVNIAFVQPSTAGGSAFPAEAMNHAFVTESGPTYAAGPQARGKRIVEFALDEAGELSDEPSTLVEYTGTGRATAAGLAAGPDGLYFTDLYKDADATSASDAGANVLQVSYAPPGSAKPELSSGDVVSSVGAGGHAQAAHEPSRRSRLGIARAGSSVSVWRRRAFARVRCFAPAQTRCRGTARLIAQFRAKGQGKSSRRIAIGRLRFAVSAGAARVVPVGLRSAARRLLRRSNGHILRAKLRGERIGGRRVRLLGRGQWIRGKEARATASLLADLFR